MERTNTLVRAIVRAQSAIVRSNDPKPLFEDLLDVVLELTDSEFGFIGETRHDSDGTPYLQTHAITNIAWDEETRAFYEEHAARGFEFRNLETLFGAVLRTGQVVIANTPSVDPRRGGTPAGHPTLESFIGLPFEQNGELLGMVGVANRPGGYDQSLVEFVQPLLYSCSFVIDYHRTKRGRDELTARLQASEGRVRGIVEAAADAIVSIDERGIVLDANRATEQLFGYSASELVGQNVAKLMPPEHAARHDGYLADYVRIGRSEVIGASREVVGRHSNGEEIPIELTVSEVHENGRTSFTGILRDIRERKRVERELSSAYAHLSGILNASTHVAIIATDPSGLITLFNTGAENMLGYRAEEMIGRHTPAVIHLPDEVKRRGEELSERYGREIRGFEAFVAKVRNGKYDRREWTYVRKDGSQLAVELTVTSVRDEKGGITGFLGVAVDVTKRKESEEELVRAKEEAEAANRAKSDFLAKMSHEIRTPMNGIMGMTELLADTPLTDEQVEYTDAINGSANLLLEIVNEVLDFSKIEARGIELERIGFPLRQVVEETLGRLRLRAGQQELDLGWTVEDDVPDRLVGDPGRLRQVLVNLVGNAIKFTEHGRITVTVALELGQPTSAVLRFDVTDTGIGIPPERQRTIFDPFTQADNATSRRYGGTGLGLAISRELVELMGGQLSLRSRVGEGSTFRFTPRFGIDDSVPTEERAPSPSRSRLASAALRILLAEDNEINQKFALRTLEKMGHDVVLAGNGLEAIEAWSRRRFDVILMDVQMPELDGLEAIARIRTAEAESGDHVPIVALTAHALDGYERKCRDAGADGYLSKPLRTADLFTMLERIGTTSTPAASPPPVSHTPLAAATLVNRELLFENLGGDDELVRELVATFDENAEALLVEIRDARASRDEVRLKRTIHGLKGSLAVLAAESTSRLAKAYEQLPDTRTNDDANRLLNQIVEDVATIRGELRAIGRECETA